MKKEETLISQALQAETVLLFLFVYLLCGFVCVQLSKMTDVFDNEYGSVQAKLMYMDWPIFCVGMPVAHFIESVIDFRKSEKIRKNFRLYQEIFNARI